MKIGIPTLVLLVAVFTMLTGCNDTSLQHSSANPSFTLENEVMDTARKWVAKSDAPGAIIAIGMPDGSIWQKAVGIAEHTAQVKELDVAYADDATNALDGTIPWRGRPMTTDLCMRIGSRTKGYTAALALKLSEEGLIDLDKTVDAYLQPGLVPNDDKVTIRMLMDMTAGIEDYLAAFSPFNLSNPSTYEDIIRYIKTMPNGGIRNAPGEMVYYSNTNYIILGMIMEKVTGKSYRELIHSKLLEPLGLRNTAVPDPNSTTIPFPYAAGYKIDLPWEMWLGIWTAENTSVDEAMAYLAAHPALVDVYAAQDMTEVHKYPDWIVMFLQANPMVEIMAYMELHPDIIVAMKAYKNGDAHALDSYPAPLAQVLISTPGLIDMLIQGRGTRKAGVNWYNCTNIYTSAVGPVGAIVSTGADQVRWIRAIEQENFLSPASQELRQQAWHPYPLVSNNKWDGYYGFGTYKKIHRATGNTLIGHGGRLEGYDCYAYLWKERGWTVVVMVNALNLNMREAYEGYPMGSVAGIIGEEIMDKLMAQ